MLRCGRGVRDADDCRRVCVEGLRAAAVLPDEHGAHAARHARHAGGELVERRRVPGALLRDVRLRPLRVRLWEVPLAGLVNVCGGGYVMGVLTGGSDVMYARLRKLVSLVPWFPYGPPPRPASSDAQGLALACGWGPVRAGLHLLIPSGLPCRLSSGGGGCASLALLVSGLPSTEGRVEAHPGVEMSLGRRSSQCYPPKWVGAATAP